MDQNGCNMENQESSEPKYKQDCEKNYKDWRTSHDAGFLVLLRIAGLPPARPVLVNAITIFPSCPYAEPLIQSGILLYFSFWMPVD